MSHVAASAAGSGDAKRTRALLGWRGLVSGAVVAVPWILFVTVKTIAAFRESSARGFESLTVVAITLGSLVAVVVGTWLGLGVSGEIRSRALRRMFPDAEVFAARNVPGFTDAVKRLDPENVIVRRREYLGLVVTDEGFTVWGGIRRPTRLAGIAWSEITRAMPGRDGYLGKRYRVALLTSKRSEGIVIRMSVSQRFLGSGNLSRRGLREFIALVDGHLEKASGSHA
jgi:hypothetical protein